MQRFMARPAVLLLAMCRTVYCWMFLVWSLSMIHVVYTNIRSLARTHLLDRGDTVTNLTFAIYSIVLSIAWWMIFRGNPGLKRWAIGANAILILNYFPVVFWNWRGFLKAELDWWPVILVGIFGIIIFSIPYHGWRHKIQEHKLAPQS